MADLLARLVIAVYFCAAAGLLLYALNCYILIFLFRRRRTVGLNRTAEVHEVEIVESIAVKIAHRHTGSHIFRQERRTRGLKMKEIDPDATSHIFETQRHRPIAQLSIEDVGDYLLDEGIAGFQTVGPIGASDRHDRATAAVDAQNGRSQAIGEVLRNPVGRRQGLSQLRRPTV